MNKYQITNMLMQNYDAFESLKEKCKKTTNGEESLASAVLSINAILMHSFDMNVKISTCESLVYYIRSKQWMKEDRSDERI